MFFRRTLVKSPIKDRFVSNENEEPSSIKRKFLSLFLLTQVRRRKKILKDKLRKIFYCHTTSA